MTVLEVLQASTDYFKKRNVESARLNAEHLLAHALGRKRIDLYLEFDRGLTEEELAPLRDLVRQRGEGRPLQHLLGTAEFCGLTFLCDKRALVPRPETEELVELLISRYAGSNGKDELTVLDVGTGSGVIALSLAAKLPNARVYGVDLSEDALTLARENADRLGLSARVDFQQGDLLENVQERFDLVVANLPYISHGERDALSREVLHDPEVALFGGEQGHELIRKLIDQAAERLTPQGVVALEIGASQRDAVISAFTQKKYKDIEAKTDYSGTPRFVFARYG
ncbi:MAG: peptide chain release factor N(5)-glutamine methyltransferase [Chthoniobacterales bacterium]